MLSRVDGMTTVRDIGYATGFPSERVTRCLDTLERLGAVDYAERPFSSSPPHGGRDSSEGRISGYGVPRSPSSRAPEASVTRDSHPSLPPAAIPPPPAAAHFHPDELLEECDLDLARKRTVLELYYQLDALDHYRLLGVPQDADRKQIKAAYYDHVRVLHPDRYFGKNLGSFREKLEKCFARLTDAHETLTAPERRAEYDEYLQSLQNSEALERSLEQTVTASDLDELARKLVTELNQREERDTLPSASSVPPSIPPVDRPASDGPVASGRQLSDEERKRALARKLRVSYSNLRIPSPTQLASSASIPPPREQIAEQLKRQYEQSRRTSQQGQLAGLLADADTAISQGDPVRATNALRNAQSIAPKDEGIADRLASAQSLASIALADTYLKQAEYEERSGRWEAAARSYERAARGKPMASTWEAAANCQLNAEGDLRTAGEYARKAIALEPERATSHLVLGRIFLAAKMRASAITELERARSLDPNNDTVTTLLARIQREDH